MIIRKYTESDRSGLVQLWSESFPNDPPHNEPSKMIEPKLQVDDQVFVAEEDGKIVPTARWEAVREGIDDYRYLRTLKQFADAAVTADDQELRDAGRAGLQLLDKIRDEAPGVVTAAKVAEKDKPSLASIGAERRRVAEAIVRIQKAAGLVEDVGAFGVSGN